jgi:hypothetical protein
MDQTEALYGARIDKFGAVKRLVEKCRENGKETSGFIKCGAFL